MDMEEKDKWSKFAALFGNMMFGSWYLMVGGVLVLHSTFVETVAYLFFGNILAALLFYFVGKLGFESGKTTYELAAKVFGKYGSRFIITILLVGARIGWVGVRAALGGLAIATILGIHEFWGILIFTALLVLVTAQQLKKLAVYGTLALIGTTLLSVMGLYEVFQHWNIRDIFDYQPETHWNIFQGMNLVLISKISFGAIVPDFFRKAASTKDVLWGSVMGFIPTGLAAGAIGALLTLVTGTYDLVDILVRLDLSLLAFSFLAISSFAPATLFPAGIGIASIFGRKDEMSRKIATAVGGVIGILLAIVGILDAFTSFLSFLGASFAPLLGVLLSHYYLIKKGRDKALDKVALISWIAGVGLVLANEYIFAFGVSSVNGLIFSAIIYYLLKRRIVK